MCYCKQKERALRQRKKAVENGIPDWALRLGDVLIDKGLHFRSRAKKQHYKRCYDRAFTYMFDAEQLFNAFLYPARFKLYPLKYLENELSK